MTKRGYRLKSIFVISVRQRCALERPGIRALSGRIPRASSGFIVWRSTCHSSSRDFHHKPGEIWKAMIVKELDTRHDGERQTEKHPSTCQMTQMSFFTQETPASFLKKCNLSLASEVPVHAIQAGDELDHTALHRRALFGNAGLHTGETRKL